jgi:hypothetical protein
VQQMCAEVHRAAVIVGGDVAHGVFHEAVNVVHHAEPVKRAKPARIGVRAARLPCGLLHWDQLPPAGGA